MLKADFQSVRGNFKFGPNQHPVQDWYALKVEKDADGTLGHQDRRQGLERTTATSTPRTASSEARMPSAVRRRLHTPPGRIGMTGIMRRHDGLHRE